MVYAFRHPMIRSVAYESQLRSDRAQLHRRLATVIEQTDEKASLIAQHYEAAGDLHAAFEWHMRAATWSTFRNFAAAQSSWLRAREVADRLPDDDADRLSMRIAPRALVLRATNTGFAVVVPMSSSGSSRNSARSQGTIARSPSVWRA